MTCCAEACSHWVRGIVIFNSFIGFARGSLIQQQPNHGDLKPPGYVWNLLPSCTSQHGHTGHLKRKPWKTGVLAMTLPFSLSRSGKLCCLIGHNSKNNALAATISAFGCRVFLTDPMSLMMTVEIFNQPPSEVQQWWWVLTADMLT